MWAVECHRFRVSGTHYLLLYSYSTGVYPLGIPTAVRATRYPTMVVASLDRVLTVTILYALNDLYVGRVLATTDILCKSVYLQ